MKDIMQKFNSVYELADYIQHAHVLAAWRGKTMLDYYTANSYEQWVGETPENALTKLSTGDAEKAAKIKAQGDILASTGDWHASRIKLDVTGCLPSVPNYLRGVPTQMMRIMKQPASTPVLDIYVNAGIWDGIDVDKVAMASAKIANIVAATEMAGVRVNLYAHCITSYDGGTHTMVVRIKDANAPLNLLNIAYPLCNRAFCRHAFMSWIERSVPKYKRTYGTPIMGAEGLDVKGVVLSIGDIVKYDRGLTWMQDKVNEALRQAK